VGELDDLKQGGTTRWHDVLVPCRTDRRAVFGYFVSDLIVGAELRVMSGRKLVELVRRSEDGERLMGICAQGRIGLNGHEPFDIVTLVGLMYNDIATLLEHKSMRSAPLACYRSSVFYSRISTLLPYRLAMFEENIWKRCHE
jgi:hypothetical protein